MQRSQLRFMQPSAVPPRSSTLSARCALLALSTTIQGGRAAFRGAFDDAGPVTEPHAEENVGVREEALLGQDDDELWAVEACAEDRADVLRVGQVKRSVDLVEDVHVGAGLNCSSAMISNSVMSDL